MSEDILNEALLALKKIEWAGLTPDTCWECCLFCGGPKEGPPCWKVGGSSRACQRGTKSCEIDHAKAGHRSDCEFVRIMKKVDERPEGDSE